MLGYTVGINVFPGLALDEYESTTPPPSPRPVQRPSTNGCPIPSPSSASSSRSLAGRARTGGAPAPPAGHWDRRTPGSNKALRWFGPCYTESASGRCAQIQSYAGLADEATRVAPGCTPADPAPRVAELVLGGRGCSTRPSSRCWNGRDHPSGSTGPAGTEAAAPIRTRPATPRALSPGSSSTDRIRMR